MTMSSNRPRDPLPAGFKSWQEFYKAMKEKKLQKQEYHLQKLEKQKQKELKKREEAAKTKIYEEPSTLSIAVPGSILDNAQSEELRTYLAGQIARAACVYKVDEVIVYDDVGIQDTFTTKTVESLSDSGEVRPARRCCSQLARILQYLECPQYLRKDFFPKNKHLEYAGLLNPLDAPHHMRMQDNGRFREGIVLVQPAKKGSYVNVGLPKDVKVNIPLQPGIRVTVEMLPTPDEAKRLYGKVVSPSQPQKEIGVYWGYSVRLASSLNAVFTECPYKEGYDVSIGTSERGKPVETVSLPSHKHALVVFGGLSGIEAALEADDILTVDDPSLLFDHYLNTCPDQGSRTIRTEEALLITLAELRTKLNPKVKPTMQSNTKKSDKTLKVYNSDSDDNEEEENSIEKVASVSDDNEETSKGDETLNSTSESCNGNFNKAKKRKKNLTSNDEIAAVVGTKKLKKKQKERVYIREETEESLDVTPESLVEITPKAKRKKDKHGSRHKEELSEEVSKTANSSIEVEENGSDHTIPKPKKKRKKENSISQTT